MIQSLQRSKPDFPLPKNIWQDPGYFIAFGFGSGTLPYAPGTFATLLAIPFYLILRPLPLWVYVPLVIFFIMLGAWLCEKVGREIHVHDHPGITIDEFAGYFVTMINAPAGWMWVLTGFILFRLFDIAKPWPISFLDKNVQGGLGVMLDDVVAGIFALVVMQVARVLI